VAIKGLSDAERDLLGIARFFVKTFSVPVVGE